MVIKKDKLSYYVKYNICTATAKKNKCFKD